MRICVRFLAALITLASMNVWSDIKTKQEIGSEAKAKAPHISSQQLSGYLAGEEDFFLLDIRTGGRSALATLTLQEMGYTNVVDLDGGFKEWVAEGNTFYNLHGENQVVNYQKKE
jgi:rhodanese-related sulfurtransferase